MPEKLGKFRCVGGHIFREEAYIQWGSSTESLGACLTLKPGVEEREHPKVQRLKDGESAHISLSPEDETLKQLEAFVRRIHYGDEPEGRLYLYNLFPLVVNGTETSIYQFETMVHRGEINPGEAVPSKEELKEHPWILIGWGINRDKGGEDLAYAKHRWMTAVKEAGVPWFGKRRTQDTDYHHPAPKIRNQRSLMIEELLSLYQNGVEALRESVEFTTAACYPNLFIRNKTSPEMENGWTLSTYDPGAIIRSFSQLKVKEGYKLGGYQFKEGENGNGIVWAFPGGENIPEAEECERMKPEKHFLRPPRPVNAISDFMQAVDGDGSPLSYLQAAVLFHELHEFGATGQGVSWTEDVFYSPEEMEVDYDWEMLREYPKRTSPCFFYNHRGRPVVRFYTINRISEVTWNEYLHTFKKGSYGLKVEKDYIATGGPGIIL